TSPSSSYTLSLHDALPILVLAALGGGAGQVGGEEVVRVAVVAGPAHEYQVVLAVLGALDQFAPFEHADVRLDADGGQVGLQHLRSEEHTSELQSRENLVCR